MWAAYAVLNLAMAALVGGVRPRRPANVVVAAMFVANGTFALLLAVVEAGVQPAAALRILADVAQGPSVTALIVLPFFFPRRRLGRRGELAVGAFAAAHVAGAWAFSALQTPTTDPWFVLHSLAPAVGFPAGILFSLQTYLQGPTRTLQNQARFILAAYLLKTMSLTYFTAGTATTLLGQAVWLVYWAALLAVPLGFLASRLGLLARDGPARPLREDAFVVGVGSLAVVLQLAGADSYPEFLLVRPLLIAYGMLHYQLLDVDLRRQWWVAASALMAGLGVLYAVLLGLLEANGLETGLASGVALSAALAAGVSAGWPLARRLLPGDAGAEARGHDLYRAALEAAAADREHTTSNDQVLGVLRTRLGISEREAALAEAEVAAARSSAGLGAGARFLGRYHVEAMLGEGGSARTFLARDATVGRRVVLKAARGATREESQRLLREARLLARLHHPAIVTIFDVEEVAGEVILVLEHMPGGSLADRLRQGPLPPGEAMALADRVLHALEAAHREGIVHRDLKPSNILRTAEGEAKLADFGVARVVDRSGTVGGFTATGAAPGTLRYMAPEQVRGEAADARTDLYALGAVLYEALSGRHYLDHARRPGLDVLSGILEDPPRLPLPGVPRPVNRLLARLLAKDPAERPASAAEARRALAAATKPAKAEARRSPRRPFAGK